MLGDGFVLFFFLNVLYNINSLSAELLHMLLGHGFFLFFLLDPHSCKSSKC